MPHVATSFMFYPAPPSHLITLFGAPSVTLFVNVNRSHRIVQTGAKLNVAYQLCMFALWPMATRPPEAIQCHHSIGKRNLELYLGVIMARILVLRVRVQIIRHFKTCMTDIYLQNECAHVGLSVHAPALSSVPDLSVSMECHSSIIPSRCPCSLACAA